jgi:cytochrome c oxidase assembly protein subunit 15
LFAWGLVGLVYLQMLLGALVAGLHTGLIYNTWPSMDGRPFPENAFVLRPRWINIFENAGLAQFDHRLVAYVVAIAAMVFWFVVRKAGCSASVRASSNALVAVIAVQIVLGIVTLLNQAPLALAVIHQAVAVAAIATALWNAFELSASAANYAAAESA